MSPFVRHEESTQSPQIQSPLARSKAPLRPTKVFSPVPQRHLLLQQQQQQGSQSPILHGRNSSERLKSTSVVDTEHRQTRSAGNGRAPSAISVLPPPPLQLDCIRHGRRLRPKRPSRPTLEGMDKSLSEGTSLSPEPCPDCLAEESIRRREDAATQEAVLTQAIVEAPSSPAEISSTRTEPGTPIEENFPGTTMIGTATDHQNVILPGTSMPGMIDAEQSSLVAADLGEMIDAIIIEHRGTLNRVITNLRDRAPNASRVQRISKELSSVSESLSSTPPKNADIMDPSKGRYSIILDTPPDFIRSRTRSIPDLLEYIDSAAKDLAVRLSPPNEEDPFTAGATNQRSDRAVDMPLNKAGAMVRDRAANKSVAPTGLANSDPDQPLTRLGEKDGNSPLLLAVNVPETMPASMPVPMIGPHNTFDEGAATHEAKAPAPHSSTGRGEDIHHDGASETKASASRIPEPQNSKDGAGSSRKHLSTEIAAGPHPPWPKSSSNSPKNPLQALKPSEIKELRQHQGTFTQPFVKEMARDASLKERSQRRARVTHDASGSLPSG
ncbi:hypothetical protein K461DRAFT_83891 [Myriangium duriaei CBS 260.36]|uniref:Uncharacterized protein n=1 Tax=Myriangium duriaei CBS 260.36 TaxID=1168546 RepID=A0A9P4JA17_9PEZI|nr:hypothetical protein K461DRAFT_83891 [Myriangium duriaei CBS 260.36]